MRDFVNPVDSKEARVDLREQLIMLTRTKLGNIQKKYRDKLMLESSDEIYSRIRKVLSFEELLLQNFYRHMG